MSTPLTVVYAGGGSGGHLSPGIAVAEAMHELDPAAQALFLCSNRAIDRTVLAGAAMPFEPIPAAPASLRPRALLRMLLAMPRATARSRALLIERKAKVVLALGGFVSVPVVRAARGLGLPVVLLNLDAVAGRANRVVARSATRVLSAIPTRGVTVDASDIVGMPVRRAAMAPAAAEVCRARLGLDPGAPTLFVTGASQGSASLNEAIPAIMAQQPSSFAGWQVVHLCGARDAQGIAELQQAYERLGVRAAVRPFLDEIGIAWGAATLAVSRAGASSVAEAAANRIPTIFVPFPYHRDQHQRLNAEALVGAGAARLARDPVLPGPALEGLAEVLSDLARDRASIERLAIAARALPRVEGARAVAAVLLGIAREVTTKGR